MRILCIAACVLVSSCGSKDEATPKKSPPPAKPSVEAKSKSAVTPKPKPTPKPTPGTELIGTAAQPWQLSDWKNSKPLQLSQLKGRVVVIRFWTNGCQFCVRSLPAMQQLADELKDKPVTFIGAYHSKPFKSERPWSEAVATATKWGVKFPIAYDRNWKTVFAWWLKGNKRKATSVTFVIDRNGKFSHIHPGPVFYPSDKPYDRQEDADFKALRAAILAVTRT